MQDRLTLEDGNGQGGLRDGLRDGLTDLLSKVTTLPLPPRSLNHELMAGVAALASLSSTLTTLALDSEWIQDRKLVHTLASGLTSCSLPQCKLEHVMLDGVAIPVKQLLGVRGNEDNASVCSIDLRFKRFSDVASILIGRLIKCNKSLTELDLRDTCISGEGAEMLSNWVLECSFKPYNRGDWASLAKFGGLNIEGLNRIGGSVGRIHLASQLLGPAEVIATPCHNSEPLTPRTQLLTPSP